VVIINTLYELIKESSKSNQQATLDIINKFSPLIKKYSRKLNYDGADTDLIIAIIVTINYLSKVQNPNIIDKEEHIVGYISKVIKNKYIELSKIQSHIYNTEVELNLDVVEDKLVTNLDDSILLTELLDKLTPLQRKVIEDSILKDKLYKEISEELGISRQAVNKLKNRALKNLKEYLEA
jgi:RNA polymerase sigma factor (sigma-70 family)